MIVERLLKKISKTDREDSVNVRFIIQYLNDEDLPVIVETFTDKKECSRLADEVEDFHVIIDPVLSMVYITVKTKK